MIIETYEINSSTCALIPSTDFSTVIIETNKTITISLPTAKIINYSCAYYGSSFKGRLNGSKYALGSKYKLPIIIEESRDLIFFPTTSFENPTCIWISLKNISNYERKGHKVLVTFNNGKKIELQMSYESFENQVSRATKLLLILKSRKKF